jgi:hypothetical protein
MRITNTTSMTGERKRENGGGTGCLDDHSAANEQTGADHAPERDHLHVPGFSACAEVRARWFPTQRGCLARVPRYDGCEGDSSDSLTWRCK